MPETQKQIQANQLHKNNKGVTLVEVIAVIAVLAVVMAAVTGFVITGAKMSAQVSGGATAGVRQQTAAEFINQRLWEVPGSAIEVQKNVPDEQNQPTDEYKKLSITVGEAKSVLTTTDGKVTYNGVVLCDGTITFRFEESADTVIYTLNEVEHVIHLRIASTETSEENT